MSYFKSLILLILVHNIINNLYAKNISSIREFETTRLKSTAGTGVASLLVDESSLLNPATLGFFSVTSFYISRTGLNVRSEESDSLGVSQYGPEEKYTSWGVIGSDTQNSLKGSASYQYVNDAGGKSSRWSMALASPIGKLSSLGVWVRRTHDRFRQENGHIIDTKAYYQTAIGAFHAVTQSLSFGAVFIDPFRKDHSNSLAIVGTQYVFQDMISLMFDFGSNPFLNIENATFFRLAGQLKIYDDFFIRMGGFRDNNKGEKGNGIGGGWVSPRLTFEAALKNSRPLNTTSNPELRSEKRKEISASMGLRF